MRRTLIRFSAYPLIFGGCASALVFAASRGLPYWPLAPLISALGILAVALLERAQPYERRWLVDHGDTLADCLHAMTSLTLIFMTVEVVEVLHGWLLGLAQPTLWPLAWPIWVQVLLAGALIDFGLWLMHWLSHKNGLLWRLHALHHSSQRLYWLNGERRHPLSALVLGLPGITAATLLGAPAAVIGTWMAIVSVHLAFQHANLDFTLGAVRKLIAVAEMHRWHHKRDYEDAQVNFGEFWLIWDHLFGTFHDAPNAVRAGEVGMRETMPRTWLAQLRWPFAVSR